MSLAMQMGMSVKRMLREFDSAEISEWMAFYEIDPWDQTRADFRSGVIASTIANANRSKKSKTYSPADFMPYVFKKEPQTWQQMKSAATHITTVLSEDK